MISIIICSRKADISQGLKDNIAATIGCEYELCVIDNSHNEYNIFTAYNEGVSRAKGDILCFMHEDVKYISNGWGEKVYKTIQKNVNIGCLGVVGTHLLADTPSGWYHSMLCSGGCVQKENINYINRQDLSHFGKEKIIEAVAVDGMWFCIPRSIFEQTHIQFDANTFTGFHCYDLDICLQIREQGYKVVITSEVLIEHSSYGSFNVAWYESTQLFYEKWHKQLPQNVGIIIPDSEIAVRTEMIKQVMVWITSYAKLEEERSRILNSKTYRLGRFLKEFNFMRR